MTFTMKRTPLHFGQVDEQPHEAPGLTWRSRRHPCRVTILITVLLLFGVQVQLSVLWLRRFRYGPVEWLWRSLTYGQGQPMRLRIATTPPTPPVAPLPGETLP